MYFLKSSHRVAVVRYLHLLMLHCDPFNLLWLDNLKMLLGEQQETRMEMVFSPFLISIPSSDSTLGILLIFLMKKPRLPKWTPT